MVGVQVWPKVSKVTLVLFPKQIMANASYTPKCVDFCLMTFDDAGSRWL